eukprot:8087735-Alexandrium_andersonii.AAC.1
MSASLVGSEMCIRDRHRAVQLRRLMPWRWTARESQSRLNGEQHKGSTVSYTHLTLPTICSV